MGAADQTIVEIYNGMVQHPSRAYNQYSLRDMIYPYVDVDYERDAPVNGFDPWERLASSATMRLKFGNLRVLSQRASILSPALLQPLAISNPLGVNYLSMPKHAAVFWGRVVKMMPEKQMYRFAHAMRNSSVQLRSIPDAGHFAGIDQPVKVAENILNFLH